MDTEIDRGPNDSDDYSIHDENVQLFETVVQYSSLETRKKPETLLLFGLSGSGKTSIVNTIYNELTGITESASQTGSGSTRSKTLDFKGRILPGTSIAAVEGLQNKNGVGCLNVVLPPCNPEWTVTKIIFVQSAADSIPEHLLDMLHDVLSEHDESLQTKYKCAVSLFRLFVHCKNPRTDTT